MKVQPAGEAASISGDIVNSLVLPHIRAIIPRAANGFDVLVSGEATSHPFPVAASPEGLEQYFAKFVSLASVLKAVA